MNIDHSAHCRACKERVRELLSAVYGSCHANVQFPWSAHPQDYANTAIGNPLERIRAALGNLRGHRDFIKSAQMPSCDYFLSDPPFIVEFDESQHFSRPRLVTLDNYPKGIEVGFPITQWQELCRNIDAKDDTPFDRDERRAWYDTLRDLVPKVHGFKPTVRLYAEEFEWCSLNSASARDREIFREILQAHRTANRRGSIKSPKRPASC
ncbi:MAG: hypothetical protein EXR70_07160 [Deltaproteobacteria bacterium]|nr:hypothetical protein [Deltaproteobacteria bacterium]